MVGLTFSLTYRPERTKGAMDEVKRPKGPPARSQARRASRLLVVHISFVLKEIFFRLHSLALTSWWTLSGSHHWPRTTTGTSRTVQYPIPRLKLWYGKPQSIWYFRQQFIARSRLTGGLLLTNKGEIISPTGYFSKILAFGNKILLPTLASRYLQSGGWPSCCSYKGAGRWRGGWQWDKIRFLKWNWSNWIMRRWLTVRCWKRRGWSWILMQGATSLLCQEHAWCY